MSSYRDVLSQDLRLVILRILKEDDDHRVNSSILQTVANARAGHNASRAAIEAELDYLESIGAVSLEREGPVTIATLTARGEDHVLRRARLPGVKTPSLD